MAYQPEIGDVADATWRSQTAAALGGDYLIEPAPSAALGSSSTAIETLVTPGVVRFGNDIVPVEQQPITHPAGPAPGSGPEGGDPDRVDLITVDSNGTAGRIVGDPKPPHPDDDPDRRFPNRRQPVPPSPRPSNDVVVVAALWVPNGTNSTGEMLADWVIPREVVGSALNDLDLIPGRDLQHVIDTARDGQTLRGDRSQAVITDQPLTVTTPGVSLQNMTLRAADGMATSNTDDLITVAAKNVTIENVTLQGNRAGQNAEPDGITVTESDSTIRNVEGVNHAGHLVNVNGGSQRVQGTTIDTLRAESCKKDALVIQGDNAVATQAANVRSFGSLNRGTVTVRNGPNETTLRDIRGEDQKRVLRLEDFGTDSPAVQNVTVDGLKASACDVAVSNGLTHDVNHADVTIEDISVARMTPGNGDSIVGLAGIKGVRILDSDITGSFTAGRGIGISTCSGVRLVGNTVNHQTPNAAGNAGIFVTNSTRVTADGNVLEELSHNGLVVQSTSSTTNNQIRVTGTETFSVGNRDLRVTDDAGGKLDRVMVLNNLLGPDATFYVNITGTKQTVNNNFGTSATS